MLIQTRHILTTLVVAGISMAALTAKAATTFAPGDLLLGFRATGGTGATTNLIVNLGSTITLRDNNTTSATLINIGSALTSAYGAGWDTRTDLFFGAIGTRTNQVTDGDPGLTGDPAVTLYASLANTGTIGTKTSSSFNPATNGVLTGTANNVAGLQSTFQNFTGTTTNGNLGAVIDTTTTLTNNWSTNTALSTDFASGKDIESAVGTSSVLDLYRILQTATGASPTGTARVGQWQGTISLSSAGVVNFDPVAAAVPEPSRVLFLACGLGSLLLRRRRAVRA